MGGGFCSSCCGCWYRGEVGLQWWLAVASRGCGLCCGLKKCGGWVFFFFFNAVVCDCGESGWWLVVVMVGGCGCGGCGGFRGGIGIIWIKVQALLEFEFKDKAKNEVVECRG